MAKRYYSSVNQEPDKFNDEKRRDKDSKGGAMGFRQQGSEMYDDMGSRRTQEMEDAGMIREDRRAIANLPQEVMIKAYPKTGPYLREGLDDTINGVDMQMDYDDSQRRAHFYPKKGVIKHLLGKKDMLKCINDVNKQFLGVIMTDLMHFNSGKLANRDKKILYNGGSEIVHVKHPLYNLRYTLLTRCYNPKPSDYKYYKAKGIQVCDEWQHSPESFFKWALNNGWKQGLSLDRIDPDKDYCPENCQFLSIGENLQKMHRQGNKKGENSGNAKLTLKQVNEIREKLTMGVVGTRIAKEYGVSNSTIYAINLGQNWKL